LNCPSCSGEIGCVNPAVAPDPHTPQFESDLGAATLVPTIRKPSGEESEGLTVASIHAIADSPYAAHLEYLHIEGPGFYGREDTVESALEKQIIALSRLGALKKLEFCNYYRDLWDSEPFELNAERAALVPTWRGGTWEDFGQN
jgi:hypothetical protein